MNRFLPCLTTLALLLPCAAAVKAAEPAASDAGSTGTYVDAPIVGWHWYNEPQPDEDAPEQDDAVPLSALPPSTQMALLHGLTKERLNRAILDPSAEHAAEYLRLQSYLMNLSGQFTQSAKKALLQYPDLDYNLEHSHYNGTAPLQLAALRDEQTNAVKTLGQKYGLFLFYRGNDAVDNQMAETVSQFAQQYGLSLIPVSMDGSRNAALPQTRPDSGQAAHLGISHYPALYLVEPGTEDARPLAYGFMTQDDLARRFLDVATDFKPQY